jgi:hypothetical protein
MRVKHELWRVSNGWLLVPEEGSYSIKSEDAPQCAIFKTLKEFADTYPKRERKTRTRKTKAHRNDPLEEHPMNPINQEGR